MIDPVNLRMDSISDCRQMAIIFMKKLSNIDSSQMFKFICNIVINNLHLTQYEKNYLIHDLIKTRDSQNIIEKVGERRLCKYCNNKVFAILYCEDCVRNYLKSKFNNWSTGSNNIDELIRECQIYSVSPSNIIEWIPFENFENIIPKTECGTSLIYTATWKNGPYIEWDAEQQILKRDGKGTYILKSLNNSNKIEEGWLKEVI
ncbi:protein kinase [Gigaspora margarita]|uniref:Protein kinase n=1 Tax=Gigaspora margarita TaxID=4874 RepID=A0A8H3XD57_GIGMA|nr:protein kinase [Gigaspora margarita]